MHGEGNPDARVRLLLQPPRLRRLGAVSVAVTLALLVLLGVFR
jgi:hypothetical protein